MKTPIEVKDIRKGDLIRVEDNEENAWEYRAPSHGFTVAAGRYYLLERPEPPFEPYWGMVIGDPSQMESRAVYIREDEKTLNWLVFRMNHYYSDGWAKQRLAEGWVVIEKPEGVK